jgi:hypothetical protein
MLGEAYTANENECYSFIDYFTAFEGYVVE